MRLLALATIVLSACEAAPSTGAARLYADPARFEGPQYAGCHADVGPDEIPWGTLDYDADGHLARQRDCWDETVGDYISASTWQYQADVLRLSTYDMMDVGTGEWSHMPTYYSWDRGLLVRTGFEAEVQTFTYDDEGHRVNRHYTDEDGDHDERWEWTEGRDGWGATVTDGDAVTSWVFDEQNRPIDQASGAEYHSWEWGDDGQLASSVDGYQDGATTTIYEYDRHGRVLRGVRDDGTFAFEQTWDCR